MSDDPQYSISSFTEPSHLQLLIEAYIALNRLNTEPGDKSHMLAKSLQFIERQIKLQLNERPADE